MGLGLGLGYGFPAYPKEPIVTHAPRLEEFLKVETFALSDVLES